ncbi:MAG: iron-sulfur cluster assembly accessory protein [Candidatus Omnitrophica bacterium]|nr:iron-sulfur cluster assembly accessory protein [Candidatus Omnitrophota bacterium]
MTLATNQPNNLKPIIHLTDAAVEKIKAMMAKDGKEGSALRVGVVTGGCAGLSYDLRFQKNPYDNDIIVTQGDLKILLNPESLAFLKGLEIHYVDTLKESGFQYKNPNASNSCGCGTSFS